MDTVEVLSPIDVMEIDIKRLFGEYCTEYRIDDMSKEKQPRFNGSMTYIYRHYFKYNNLLKSSPNRIVDNSINGMMTNHNAYDINTLYELYIFLKEFANGYDKVASIKAFMELTGISRQTLSVWRNKDSSHSSLDCEKKKFIEWLASNEEDDLKEFNLRTPLGAQERLNVDYGRREIKMSMHVNSTINESMTPDEIAAKYDNNRITDNQLSLPQVPD